MSSPHSCLCGGSPGGQTFRLGTNTGREESEHWPLSHAGCGCSEDPVEKQLMLKGFYALTRDTDYSRVQVRRPLTPGFCSWLCQPGLRQPHL